MCQSVAAVKFERPELHCFTTGSDQADDCAPWAAALLLQGLRDELQASRAQVQRRKGGRKGRSDVTVFCWLMRCYQ